MQIFTPLPLPLPPTPQVRLKARGVERTCYKWAVQVFSGEPKKSKGLIGGEPSSSSSCNRLEGKGELEDRLQMLLGREKWVLSVLAQVFSTR